MEQVTIQHVLGSWTVNVYDSYDAVPSGAIQFANTDRGFQSKGHAIGYVNGRWDVLISGGK